MYCQIWMVWHVSLFFFHLSQIWLSDRWSLGSVLCCIHTLCQLSLHSGHCSGLSGSVTESATAWHLSLLHADSGKKLKSVPLNTPLYPDNPSIICYIACYLHDNLCLIFQPFNLKKKRKCHWWYLVVRCILLFYSSQVHFFSFYLGHQTSQPTESNYIGENINPIKKVKEIKEMNCASKGIKLWCKYPDIDSYRHTFLYITGDDGTKLVRKSYRCTYKSMKSGQHSIYCQIWL